MLMPRYACYAAAAVDDARLPLMIVIIDCRRFSPLAFCHARFFADAGICLFFRIALHADDADAFIFAAITLIFRHFSATLIISSDMLPHSRQRLHAMLRRRRRRITPPRRCRTC